MKFVFVCLLLVPSAIAATFTVTMNNTPAFVPSDLTISVGDTVIWRNTQGFHDTVSGTGGVPDGVWDSNNQFRRLMFPGETFSFTFSRPGTYPYYCTPHWSLGMVGTIRVLAANVPPAVTFISPPNLAELSAPADITVEVSASDSDGNVTQVELFMNGSPIGFFVAAPYRVTVNGLGPGNYTFSAVAMDDASATGSASVSVTVSGREPAITVGPRSRQVNVGNDVTFSVEANGSPPLSYQWFFGLSPIPGASASSLLLTNVTAADSGTYMVRVSNDFGSASASADLSVTNAPSGTPPSITLQPESQTVTEGTNVTFTVDALSASPTASQWFFNGSPIANATNVSLTLTNVTLAEAGEYFLIVANDFGSTTSVVATLTVRIACNFALDRRDASLKAQGGSGSVTVTAPSGCSWTVINTNTWITITSGNSGTATATVDYTVAPNPSELARSGVLLIAGIVFDVRQAGLFPAKNDFNHDGQTDILWERANGPVILWLMDGVTRISAMPLRNGRPAPLGWHIVGTHDFDVDGNEDILWQRSNGSLEIWLMNGTNFLRGEPILPAPALGRAWQAVGLGDFNNDNSTDVLFRHSEGYLQVWYMKGKRFWRQGLLVNGTAISTAWRLVGVADLDDDGYADILWQKANSALVVWFKPGVTAKPIVISYPPPVGARIVGLNDLNQDRKTDFIWRHADGHLSVWWMNGTNRLESSVINGGQVVAPGLKFAAPKN